MKKIIFLSLTVIVTILFFSQIKRSFISLCILADVVRPPEKAFMGRLFDGPLVKKADIAKKGGNISADLYVPKGNKREFPLLLVHGADPTGKDEKRIQLLAKDLSRAGFLVLVPDLEGIKKFRVRLADAEDILRSYQYLISQKQAAGRGGAMIGMDFGSGPMLLAAADQRIRDKIRVLATFGGYYDLRTVIQFGLTGAYEYGSLHGLIKPDTSVRWMLAYRNLDVLLRMPGDRTLFRTIIEKRNQYELAKADTLARTLHAEGQGIYSILLNGNPERFSPRYEALSHAVREYVYQLSPSRAMKYINAYCIVVHATDDHTIPYTESMKLADAAGGQGRVRLALLPQFFGNETAEPSFGDLMKRYGLGGWRLFIAIYDLLEKSE
jgi:hypothetical protein